MALGVVKQICTPSSAARPPVNHPKGSLPLLSTLFLTSPPSISSLFFLFFCIYISFTLQPFLFSLQRSSLHDYSAYESPPPRNAMEFGAGCGSSTHASLQKLKEATLSLPASRAIVPFDTKEEGVRTQETLVITSIRSRRRRIVYFNLVPLTRGIKESRTTFTLLLYTPRGETSRSLPL